MIVRFVFFRLLSFCSLVFRRLSCLSILLRFGVFWLEVGSMKRVVRMKYVSFFMLLIIESGDMVVDCEFFYGRVLC